MKKPLDLNTFGDSPCHISLARILSKINNDKLVSSVSTILHKNLRGLRVISSISDKAIRENIFALWRKQKIAVFETMKGKINESVRTYAQNCIVTDCKRAMKKINAK